MDKETITNNKLLIVTTLSLSLFASLFSVLPVLDHTYATTDLTNEVESEANQLEQNVESETANQSDQAQQYANQTVENPQTTIN